MADPKPLPKRARRDLNDLEYDEKANSPMTSPSSSTTTAQQQQCNAKPLPTLPRDGRLLLLDIEGGITCQKYAKEYLAEYVIEKAQRYLEGLTPSELLKILDDLQADFNSPECSQEARNELRSTLSIAASTETQNIVLGASPGSGEVATIDGREQTTRVMITECIQILMKYGVRQNGILSIQGNIWREGRKRGELNGHIYPDVIPTIRRCKALGISVCLFANLPIQEQKQLFKISSQGDLTPYIAKHFDTCTIGKKNEASSYAKIAEIAKNDMDIDVKDIIFLSVEEEELCAARKAGMNAVIRRRPANWSDLISGQENFPVCSSMMHLFD